MPENNKFNQFQVPIDLATEMASTQIDQVINQIMGPDKPTRIARLGEQPADPIIQGIVNTMREDIQ